MPNIIPQPVPTSVTVQQAQTSGGVMVVLTIEDPTGLGVWFFPPANAKTIGEQLVQAGEAGNILIAQPGQVPDLGAARAATSEPPGPNRAERRDMAKEIQRVRGRS